MEILGNTQDQFPRLHNLDKHEMYKTAFCRSTGNYVKLIKYNKRLRYYEVESISGERFSAGLNDLERFVL